MRLATTLIRSLVFLGTLTIIAETAASQTPPGAFVITVRNARKLAIVDPQAMTVAGAVPLGGGFPHEVAVSADGKFAFVTINPHTTIGTGAEIPQSGYAISVIDLTALKESHRIEIGPGSLPHGVVLGGGEVYFTAEGYRLVERFNPATDQIDWMQGTAQIRTHMLVISKDLNKIFTANTGSNSVTEMVKGELPADYQRVDSDSPPPWNVTQIPTGSGPEGIAMSPDEKEVWVATRNDGGVSIIDVATKKVTQRLTLSETPAPATPAFTPDGKRVIIADNAKGDVLVIDAHTRKEIKRITNVGSKPHAILIAPDGSRAYVANEGADNIAIIDLNKLKLIDSITVGDAPEKMAWVGHK
jgi:YVTN family beta-propeller protein